MRTELLYLNDSYLKEMDAEILDVADEAPGKYRVILNQTVFYPLGGGQPTDQGELTADGNVYKVYLVQMKDGEVWHFVESEAKPEVGTKVKGTINWDRRYVNMRNHSGGHVVDFAMHLLGYSPSPLMPFRGDHGKKPFITYQGILGKDIREELEAKSNELIEKGLEFSWYFQPLEDLEEEAIYLQPGLPTNKPLRTLKLDTVGAVADGGTQVHNTKEVGKISIPSVEEKDGNTTVTYIVE